MLGYLRRLPLVLAVLACAVALVVVLAQAVIDIAVVLARAIGDTSTTLAEVYGYEDDWGVPSDADIAAITDIMIENGIAEYSAASLPPGVKPRAASGSTTQPGIDADAAT